MRIVTPSTSFESRQCVFRMSVMAGVIPETFGHLGSVQTMDLHSNRLSGEWGVPISAICQGLSMVMTSLEELDVRRIVT